MFLAKDFIEITEGLVFAVVENGMEQEKVLCFLRYIQNGHTWKKVDTAVANQILSEKYPQYLYYSKPKDAHLHAVSAECVVKHHQPRLKLKTLLTQPAKDAIENDLQLFCRLLEKQGVNLDKVGITGSILISAQNTQSDIDLVFYCRELFHLARRTCHQLIQQSHCEVLSDDDWKDAFQRRDCELSIQEYLWHEKRKFNKVCINQRKVDLSLVSDVVEVIDSGLYKKLEATIIKVQIEDDALAFDYPSIYAINHPQIQSIISFTATYTGQAKIGEWVEVAGLLEQASDGRQRIVVGSTREATGEYIKVVDG
jgi:hypothetical protein